MDIMMMIGIGLTILGIVGLLGCAAAAYFAKRKGIKGFELSSRLQPLVPINLALLGVSIVGLMLVTVSILFH